MFLFRLLLALPVEFSSSIFIIPLVFCVICSFPNRMNPAAIAGSGGSLWLFWSFFFKNMTSVGCAQVKRPLQKTIILLLIYPTLLRDKPSCIMCSKSNGRESYTTILHLSSKLNRLKLKYGKHESKTVLRLQARYKLSERLENYITAGHFWKDDIKTYIYGKSQNLMTKRELKKRAWFYFHCFNPHYSPLDEFNTSIYFIWSSSLLQAHHYLIQAIESVKISTVQVQILQFWEKSLCWISYSSYNFRVYIQVLVYYTR